MVKAHTSNYVAYLGLVAAMMLWASSFVALKLAFRGYDPMIVIFGRMLVASICFLPLLPRFRSENPFRRQDLKPLLFMAFCEPCLYFVFEARALVLTSASQAGMITALLPLMVAVCARMVLKEALTPGMLAGFVLAIAGAGWLSLAGEATAEAPRPLLGNFLEFMAMVCATGYTISLKRLTRRYTPLFLTAVQAFTGAVFFLPALWFPSTTWPVHFAWQATLAIIYLGAFITLGAYGLYNFGVSRIPASQASIFVNLIPVFAVILGRFILDERFTRTQYMASALVFAGIYVSQRTTAASKRSVSAPREERD